MAALLSLRVLQITPALSRGMRDYRKAMHDPELPMINIGFPLPEDFQYKTNSAPGQPIKSLDVEKIRQHWHTTIGVRHIRNSAVHYGIYRDMFSNGFFYPTTHLQIFYCDENDVATPVFNGNHLKPSEVAMFSIMKSMPEIEFPSDPQSLWTLVATNLDCHFEQDSFEYLLWFVGNIRGNDISTGETICDYLQPFPAKGSGYQRVVFVLYKQDEKINYNSLKRQAPCLNLKARTFLTNDFYKEHQSHITPAGLGFCQVDWDESMKAFFHNVLKMREPMFEYDHAPQYIKPQVWNPHKKQFDTYLDKHRPMKELAEEVLLMRLQRTDPFLPPQTEQYPLVHSINNSTATWVKKQMRQQHMRWGKYRDL
uniref:Large ribosomal subunit protein mL38 n=1 Tax=Strigamia maritima TaxID=126957 RepID=T1IS83_STRMM